MNNELFEKLASNKKYSDVCPDAIRRVIAECEGRYKKARDMEKAVREKLHGITSAFNELGGDICREVLQLSPGDDEALASILRRHASTRERLPLAAMDKMYARIFEVTGQPDTILDLACGLNPVYLLRRFDCDVVGVDISKSCVELIGPASQDASRGVWGDLLCEGAVPSGRFHIALMFKILPLLERQKAGSALQIMQAVNAAYLVVSFPTRTLGGRNVGMADNYARWMQDHLPACREIAAAFETENELFYILKEK